MLAEKRHIENLSWMIYECEGSRGGISVEFLDQFRPELGKLDPKDVLVYQFNNFDYSYSSTFTLCLPELWSNFSVDDWRLVLRQVQVGNRIPNRTFPLDLGKFSDLIVLYKFLEIDSIELFVSLDVPESDKTGVLTFFNKNPFCLFKTDEDFDNMKEGFISPLEVYYECRNRLLNESDITAASASEDILLLRLKNLLKR